MSAKSRKVSALPNITSVLNVFSENGIIFVRMGLIFNIKKRGCVHMRKYVQIYYVTSVSYIVIQFLRAEKFNGPYKLSRPLEGCNF